MKALKISLVSIFAILFITAISVISVYAADNHKQIKSWVNNAQEEQPKDPELAAAQKLVEQLRQELEERNSTITELENNIQEIKTEVTTANETIDELQQDNSKKENEITALQTKIEQNNQKIEEYKQNEEQNAEEIARLTKENEENQASIIKLQGIIDNNKQFIEGLQTLISQKTAKITELEATIEEKNSQLQELQSTIGGLQQGSSTANFIDKYCAEHNIMIVCIDESACGYPSLSFYDSTEEDFELYGRPGIFMRYPTPAFPRVHLGWSYTPNGELINQEDLKFEPKFIVLYHVVGESQQIEITLHLASNKSIQLQVYQDYEYNTLNWNNFPKICSEYFGTTRIGEMPNDITKEKDPEDYDYGFSFDSPGDYYAYYYSGSFDDYYALDIEDEGKTETYVINKSQIDGLVSSIQFNDITFEGLSLEQGGQTVKLTEELLKQHNKFYVKRNYEADSEIYMPGEIGTKTVPYARLQDVKYTEETNTLQIADEEFKLSGITFMGFSTSSYVSREDELVKTIDTAGKYYIYFAYEGEILSSSDLDTFNLYADVDSTILIQKYITSYRADHTELCEELNNFDFSGYEKLRDLTFQGWTSRRGAQFVEDLAHFNFDRDLYAVFER